ncbi:hypothetical protein, partial [Pseudoflavonifractor sp. An184]|uniref:hypothetical protein n=1 Tax=Pseudoflavonifractor sp. An184 TaxID=1965576 RepID=UPI0019516164
PPRVGSNALNALYDKAFSERSEDFSAAQRRESIGIFQAAGKVFGLFRQPETAPKPRLWRCLFSARFCKDFRSALRLVGTFAGNVSNSF